jgi:hypothetical protein
MPRIYILENNPQRDLDTNVQLRSTAKQSFYHPGGMSASAIMQTLRENLNTVPTACISHPLPLSAPREWSCFLVGQLHPAPSLYAIVNWEEK